MSNLKLPDDKSSSFVVSVIAPSTNPPAPVTVPVADKLTVVNVWVSALNIKPSSLFKAVVADPDTIVSSQFVVSSVASAVVIVEASVALPALPDTFPVTSPVTAPVKLVAVKTPLLGLYVNPVSDSKPCDPVAPSTNTG